MVIKVQVTLEERKQASPDARLSKQRSSFSSLTHSWLGALQVHEVRMSSMQWNSIVFRNLLLRWRNLAISLCHSSLTPPS
jgi:hypothetical protein